MESATQRSAFEQQLCQQLLSFSALTEALAERVLLLENRLVGVEQQLAFFEQPAAVDAGIVDLLAQSEDRVRKLKDVLGAGEVIALDAVRQLPETNNDDPLSDQVSDGSAGAPMDDVADDDAVHGETEMAYIDDPQIDLLSA